MGRLAKEQRAMMGMTVDQAVCMERAAQSSGVPFATLARAAKAARKALAECGRSTWTGGGVTGDYDDPQNWLYSRLPCDGDTVIFDARSDRTNTGGDLSHITLGTFMVTKAFADAHRTIGQQGRTL